MLFLHTRANTLQSLWKFLFRIGFAIARRLAQEGAHVVISSRKEKKVNAAVEILKSEGLSVLGMVCHVSNSDHRRKLVEKVRVTAD